MVTAPHTPVPFSGTLEDLYMPDAQRVVNAVKTVTGWSR
jgi:pyruvate dehydrogenase E1 component beta subunit